MHDVTEQVERNHVQINVLRENGVVHEVQVVVIVLDWRRMEYGQVMEQLQLIVVGIVRADTINLEVAVHQIQ